MSLNIKNEYVHDLARQAAAVTGKTQTGAMQEALEALLAAYGEDPAQTRRAATKQAALRIAAAYRADPGTGDDTVNGSIRTIDDLYDTTTGLPR